jgi:hypothetical protein
MTRREAISRGNARCYAHANANPYLARLLAAALAVGMLVAHLARRAALG